MIDSASARTEVLRRIRNALPPAPDAAAIDAAWHAIPRQFRRSAALDHEGLLELFEDRLRDYDAGVYRSSAADAGAVVARILAERGKRRIAIPDGVPAEWLPEGIVVMRDDRDGIAQLDSCDGVLTSAMVAIAETGTIVLQDVPGQGRRAATLLPDYHLCVVDTKTLVETVPQAFAHLQKTAALATTFFSGPSATADIEMTRIKGVHGPRFVDVVLVV